MKVTIQREIRIPQCGETLPFLVYGSPRLTVIYDTKGRLLADSKEFGGVIDASALIAFLRLPGELPVLERAWGATRVGIHDFSIESVLSDESLLFAGLEWLTQIHSVSHDKVVE